MFGFINTLLEGLTRVQKHFQRNEKKMFYLCQVSTGHYEKYFNIFLRSVLVRTPCKPHFCSLHELHVLCISKDKPTTKLTHIERRHREVNPGRISERPGLSLLHHLCSPNKICCFSSSFCSDSVVKTILSASVSDTFTEVRSFRPTAFARTLVDSPNDIQHCTTW